MLTQWTDKSLGVFMLRTQVTKKTGLLLFYIAAVALVTSCQAKKSEDSAATTPSQYLYVASGTCFSGVGNTTFTNLTASNLVYRINPGTGQRDTVIADYSAQPSSTGDSPTGLASIDSANLAVLVENATTTSLRRIEKISKSSAGSRQTFSNNTTALSTPVRNLMASATGDFFVTRTTGIELLTSANVRIGAPYINPSVIPCASSNTSLTKFFPFGSSGKYVFLHAAGGQNRVGIFASAGGTTCASGQNSPTAAASPTAAFYDSVNQMLIVAYAGNTTATDVNSIYAYSINETTGAFSSPQKIYDSANYPGTQPYLLYGISDMAFDAASNTVYIATAISTATTVVNYAIEKFTYNPSLIGTTNLSVLTRVGTTPFYPYGVDTKCVSQMILAN
jgi:hypothetical protein